MKARSYLWWLAASLVLSLVVFLVISWPKLLQQGLMRLLAEQGWQLVSMQGPRTGLRQLALDSLVLRRAGEGGSTIAVDLRDVKAEFSWRSRRLSLLQTNRVGLHWQQARTSAPASWPELPAIALPLDRLQVDTLDLRVDLADGRQWIFSTPVQLEQSSVGRHVVTFEVAGQPVQTKLQTGESTAAELSWPTQIGSVDSVLNVTYAIKNNSNCKTESKRIKVSGKIDLESTAVLLNRIFPARSFVGAKGKINLNAKAILGNQLGEWNSLAAELKTSDVQVQFKDSGKTALQIDGNLSIEINRMAAAKPAWSARLKPGLAITVIKTDPAAKAKSWQARLKLDQVYTLHSGASQDKLPMTLWLGAAKPLKFVIERLRLLNIENPAQFEASGQLRMLPSSFHPDWPQVGISANWRWHAGQLKADGKVDGKLASQDQLVLADWRGDYASKSGCANFELKHAGQLSQLNGLLHTRPAALMPLTLQSGSSEGRLTGRYCSGTNRAISLSGEFEIRQGKLGWAKTLASGLDLKLRIDDLQGRKGSLSAELERVELAAGLQLSPVQLKLDLANNRLGLREFQAGLLDGSIVSEPATLPMPPRSGTVVLNVKQVDLERLLTMIDLPGLAGTGRLTGRLPVSWTNSQVVVLDGQLQSTIAGQLRYQPSTPVSDNIGLQALRDFRYSRLDLGVNYDAAGKYRLVLKLDGHNPQLYSGHPIEFKVNINGALPGLFQGALLSGDFSAYLLKQLQQGKLQ
ncbi:YdbH domain-containing protein [Malikia sp.]|uniref:intermembrane phospholipid transport protein YdbH family protein n=1 Tax=Malikia sp. TaxID=2070706 RepID=UPI00261DFA3B|nr:YdbH domain-containing protein [Malikia sp.]MDD2728557.1 YdbH domain-containing protein [Malikia sp.]